MEFSADQRSSLGSALRLARLDFIANRSDPKAQFVTSFFRVAHWARSGSRWKLTMGTPIVLGYRLTVEMLLGIELRPRTAVGSGLRLFHGQGLVVNDRSVLGKNVTLRHGVTIGSLVDGGPCPTIEDEVEFGAGSMVLGPVRVGRGARIGAGAVVVKDVPAGGVARGPSAEIFLPKLRVGLPSEESSQAGLLSDGG